MAIFWLSLSLSPSSSNFIPTETVIIIEPDKTILNNALHSFFSPFSQQHLFVVVLFPIIRFCRTVCCHCISTSWYISHFGSNRITKARVGKEVFSLSEVGSSNNDQKIKLIMRFCYAIVVWLGFNAIFSPVFCSFAVYPRRLKSEWRINDCNMVFHNKLIYSS